MKKFFMSFVATLVFAMLSLQTGFAQNAKINLSATLVEAGSGEAVGFATVSLTQKGSDKVYKYTLSGEKGNVFFEDVKAATYIFKVELMGYLPLTKEIVVKASQNLGNLELQVDQEVLDQASVSAVGNAIIVKKDTVEYNANAFKTTDTDALEDLLKKFPGMEVSENGSITFNGEAITQIRIDGKTFFLNDPAVASKNLPAKMVDKLKVIKKKSEQAEFTGIDDGERETIIDLSVRPGMMNGIFGTAMGGGGADIPSTNVQSEGRWQGSGFVGNFRKNTQISLILNGNNTNNRGAMDLAGNMMGALMGGGGMMGRGQGGFGGGIGGGNGITTSALAGLNVGFDAFEGKMNASGNYMYNWSNSEVKESSDVINRSSDQVLYSSSDGMSSRTTGSNSIGMRIDHKFSDNTSILLEPSISFGGGHYTQGNTSTTARDSRENKVNDAMNTSTGENNNWTAGGSALLRQRLGIPGRTLTVRTNLNFSKNEQDALTFSKTTTYMNGTHDEILKQNAKSNSNTQSIGATATYTEPMGNNFYLEGNYSYRWNKTSSDKFTYDWSDALNNYDYSQFNGRYSSKVINNSQNNSLGFNLMYQDGRNRYQAGVTVQNDDTKNETASYNSLAGEFQQRDPYHNNVWRVSPQVSLQWDFSDYSNLRTFYRGNSSQPSVNQLNPVPDVTNPLRISFGNPTLKPYFSHSIRGDFSYNNRQKFSSFTLGFNGGFTQSPIVNLTWYGANGGSFSIPVNGPNSYNASVNAFINTPIVDNLTVSNTITGSWNQSNSYDGGSRVDMTTYNEQGYYAFMDEMINNFNDPTYFNNHIKKNTTNSFGASDRLRLVYRLDDFELVANASSNMNYSTFSISELQNSLTFRNAVGGSINWTISKIGVTTKADMNYNWYVGYINNQAPEYILNAEIQKSILGGLATFAIKGYDILGQAKNLTVSESGTRYSETVNNTLGRYVIASLTIRFGSFGGMRQGIGSMIRNGGGLGGIMGGGMPGMGGGMMGGGMMGGGFGGRR